MRVLSRKKEGIVLKIEHEDDLWQLAQLLDEGDVITGRTERKVVIGDKSSEKARVERKTITLSITVEETDLDTALRVQGVVAEGTDDVAKGSHHTITLEPGDTVQIAKEWSSFQLQRLKEATTNNPLHILLVLFDREDALFALLKQQGHVLLGTLKGAVAKKAMKSEVRDFYKEIAAALTTYDARYALHTIIAASPAFWSEYLLKELPAELRKKTRTVTCSSITEQAIPEVLRRPELQNILQQDSSSRDAAFLKEIMEGIAKDRAVYTEKAVKKAISDSNVRTVVITSDLLKKKKRAGEGKAIESLLKQAEQAGATIHLITTEQATKELQGIGGIACLSRWAVHDG